MEAGGDAAAAADQGEVIGDVPAPEDVAPPLSARAAKNSAPNEGKQVRTMGSFSSRSHSIGPTAKRFNPIAQGKRSAVLGWRLGKNHEP